MVPPNPSKCSVFNLNLEQKPHPKLKMNLSSGVSLKCTLFKSQCAHERKDKDDWVVVLPRKESVKPLKILPDRDRISPTVPGTSEVVRFHHLYKNITDVCHFLQSMSYHRFKLFSLFL